MRFGGLWGVWGGLGAHFYKKNSQKTMSVYFKKGKSRTKYTVSFDSEEICWLHCHVDKWKGKKKNVGSGDTAGKPKVQA